QAFDSRAHQGHCENTDHDAQRREHRAQLVGPNGAPGNEQAFLQLREKFHVPLGSSKLQHPTSSEGSSNVQHATSREDPSTKFQFACASFGAWMLELGCWIFVTPKRPVPFARSTASSRRSQLIHPGCEECAAHASPRLLRASRR